VIPSLLCDQGSLVSRRTQDYKSLCAAVTICAALVNTQTHTYTHRPVVHPLWYRGCSEPWKIRLGVRHPQFRSTLWLVG